MAQPAIESSRTPADVAEVVIASPSVTARDALKWLVRRVFPQSPFRCVQASVELLVPDCALQRSLVLVHADSAAMPSPDLWRRLRTSGARVAIFIERSDSVAVRLSRIARNCTILDAATESIRTLAGRLRRASRGHVHVSASIRDLATRLPQAPELLLTPAQTRVLEVIGTGADDAEASVRLGIRPATVMTHRSAVMRKLGVRQRGELVRAAIRYGYVTVGPDGELGPARETALSSVIQPRPRPLVGMLRSQRGARASHTENSVVSRFVA